MPEATWAWLTPAAPAAIALLHCPPCPGLLTVEPVADRIRFTGLCDPDGTVVDEVVASCLPDGSWEIGCHGGPGVRAAVERALRAHGLCPGRPVSDRHWHRLANAASPAALTWLLNHPTDEPPFPAEFLSRPIHVLLTGPANAGKSSLLNSWCGHARALVSDVPGTTRDLVAAETLCGGWRLRLLDSAGLREAGDQIERAGQDLVVQARRWVDAVVHLSPADAPMPPASPTDLPVCGKVDLLTSPPDGLGWAVPEHLGEAASARCLAAIETALLQRLGLPRD